MRAGLLRERIDLLRPVTTVGDEWGHGTNWPSEASVWAQVTPSAGAEKASDTAVQASVSYDIRIRFVPDVASDWRIVWRGRSLDIVSVVDATGRGRELEIKAVENVSNG
jgi:SPP1 family predicted phage head-tail adaptor